MVDGVGTLHQQVLPLVVRDFDVEWVGAYALLNNGSFFNANTRGPLGSSDFEFVAGDIVGCGVILDTRQLLFTKNGRLLDSVSAPSSPESSGEPSTSAGPVSLEAPLSPVVLEELFGKLEQYAVGVQFDALFPFVALRSPGDKIEANFGPKFVFDITKLSGGEVEEHFPLNRWHVPAFTDCHQCVVEFSGPHNSVVRCAGTCQTGFPTVFAQLSVSESGVAFSFIIRYFEITVKQMADFMSIGFDSKPTNNGRHFSFWSDGRIYINDQSKPEKETFRTGDTVGCGFISDTQRFFYTKNGYRLDLVSDFSLASSISADNLFPFVSLHNSGDRIEANFGPKFLFDLSSPCC